VNLILPCDVSYIHNFLVISPFLLCFLQLKFETSSIFQKDSLFIKRLLLLFYCFSLFAVQPCFFCSLAHKSFSILHLKLEGSLFILLLVMMPCNKIWWGLNFTKALCLGGGAFELKFFWYLKKIKEKEFWQNFDDTLSGFGSVFNKLLTNWRLILLRMDWPLMLNQKTWRKKRHWAQASLKDVRWVKVFTWGAKSKKESNCIPTKKRER